MAELRTLQPSFTAGVLSPALWARVDLAKYASGLKIAENMFLHPHGGVSNRTGTEFIRETKVSANLSRLIPFQFNTEQSYVLEFGENYMRVFKNGAVVLLIGVPYEMVTPYSSVHVRDLVFAQEADVMYIVHPSYAVRKLSRLADNNWTLTVVTFAPSQLPPTVPVAAPLVGAGGTNYRYRVSSVNADSGEESLPGAIVNCNNDLTVVGNKNRVSWNASLGADRYIVYKEDNGVFGYIGGTSGFQLDDDNIVPDLSDTPQLARNPFNAVNSYPRAVTFVEQRLAFGSTNDEPQGVWLSQSANYENFGYSSPAKPSDAVTFRIRARQVNEIRAMLPTRGLLLLTSGAEWIITGGSQSDAISPSAIKIDNQGFRGCARLQPIVVGNTVLFAQERGGVVRDFSYQFADDAFVGKDLTILARHLFENKSIKAWAYSQAPYSIVWVILNDGSLVSLTYIKEHEVWGWTHHKTLAAGQFEDVVVVDEGNEDVPYFIVKRTINGVTKRYVERLHSRYFPTIEDAFFVDCGLSYSGAPITNVAGLGHLEGQQVIALANGNVVRGLTVTAGAVTLPNPATKLHIGLPLVAKLQTLDLDLGQIAGLGTVQGRQKSISEVTLRVQETRGIWIGPKDGERTDTNTLVEYKQRSTEAWNEAIRMYTGDIQITPHWDWTDGGNMWVKQFDPLPMTVLAIMPDVTIGR